MMEDHLEVIVTQDDKIFLPTSEGNKEIGTYEQTTIQKISPEEVATLVEFVESENEKATTQLNAISKQIIEIGEVTELDQDVVEACRKQIGKGTKVFKQKMLVLNNHLEQITRKKSLLTQKEYIDKQLTQMNTELADLKEAIN